jgi:hypothetical protein
MNDLALHLVDEVIPRVPVRQWICSMPWSLRVPMGYDRGLCNDVLAVWAQELSRSYRWRAKRLLGLPGVERALPGSVTVVQRWDSAVRLCPHPHTHTLCLDGVYVRSPLRPGLEFIELPEPTDEELYDLAARVASCVERVLVKHGRHLDGPDMGDDGEQTVLASCLAASARGLDIMDGRAGRPTQRLRDVPPVLPTHGKPLPLAEVRGFDIHAARTVHVNDRAGIERLVRYIARPPIASERLHVEPDGRVRYDMKRTWADGTTSVRLAPLDFIARLCAIVPPPWFNLTRYHGVLASGSPHRAGVVPCVTVVEPPERQLWLPGFERGEGEVGKSAPRRGNRPAGRHPWAQLLERTFRVDATTCPRCSQPLRLVEIATTPEAIRRVMTRAGLAPMPPPPPIPKPHDQVALQI